MPAQKPPYRSPRNAFASLLTLVRLLKIAILIASTSMLTTAYATEPLFDRISIAEKSGNIFPEKCCWIELPKSERLREVRRAQQCSAIGGPVGKFRIEDKQLWLDALRTCGEEMPLDAIYPDMHGPVVASWLSGNFRIQLTFRCPNVREEQYCQSAHVLVLREGQVVSLTEKPSKTGSNVAH
jgi:hypothetical protein